MDKDWGCVLGQDSLGVESIGRPCLKVLVYWNRWVTRVCCGAQLASANHGLDQTGTKWRVHFIQGNSCDDGLRLRQSKYFASRQSLLDDSSPMRTNSRNIISNGPRVLLDRRFFIRRRFQRTSHDLSNIKAQSLPALKFPSKPKGFAPASTQHQDLASFLTYAESASLSPRSTVYVGTRYEYICAAALCRLGFTLDRCGGANDHGIDLIGRWQIPSRPEGLRVLVQCKADNKAAGPRSIRELEGMVVGAPDAWQGENTIGVLCAKRPASDQTRQAVRRAGMPVVWIMISEEEGDTPRVKQILWNQNVEDAGLMGGALKPIPRYSPAHEKMNVEIALMWKGHVWDPHWEGQEEDL